MSNKTHRNLSDKKSNCPPEGCRVAERKSTEGNNNKNNIKAFAGMCAVWPGLLLCFLCCLRCENKPSCSEEEKLVKTVEKVLVK
jgi:hypothetical protein